MVFIVACSEEEENEGESHLKTLQKEGIEVPACHGATGQPSHNTRQRNWLNLCIKRQTQPQSKVVSSARRSVRCKPGKSVLRIETSSCEAKHQ